MNRYLLIGIGLVGAAIIFTFWPREKPEVGVSAPLPPAKEVRTVEKVRTEVKVVYVYPEKVKAKLDLPPAVVDDKAKQVIATGKLAADARDYTLSAVLDTDTGNSEVYARPDPLPWIGPGKRGAVGVAYGTTAKAYISHDLLQVKALHAGARAEIDQRGEWWAGGYVEYRW